MMSYNLSSTINEPLRYPHYTKMSNGEAHIVTHPEKLFKVDDVICFNENSETANKPYKVLEILEQREAKGEHSVDFVPVFQKLRMSVKAKFL